MPLQAAIQGSEEGASLAVVVFPRVLSVEHDEDGGLCPAVLGVVAVLLVGAGVRRVARRRPPLAPDPR